VRSVSILGIGRGAGLVAALVAFPFLFPAHWIVNIAIFTVMYAALATAWNLMCGYSGYLSLGHAAFFGFGAYGLGIVFARVGVGSGYRPFAVLPAIGLAVAAGSVPVAWLALRVRAATFAIVTISGLFIVQQLAFNLHGLTNGAQGLELPIAPFPTGSYERPFYLAMVGVYTVALVACWYVATSKIGLMLFAVRDDEDRARGLGIHVTYAKVVAFALSVGLTAMAGGIWAYYIGFVYPQFAVDPLITIGTVLMVYLGGKGTLWGPTVGSLILVPTQQYMAYSLGASQYYLIGYAAVFLIIMLVMPRGILPSLADLVAARRPSNTTPTAGDSAPSVTGAAT
jgi:branched-chain amino acid transport system permease protein